MTDLKATFAALLEQTLAAPRLSGSKVQTLITHSQTLTAQNQDTEVVTTFYRVNAGLLPASTGRISSLYVFDAIARAARKDADKEKEKGKARDGRGMTGLITKMEGVVDAWVMGMVDDGKGGVWVEGKDKVRKILDIWRKGSTFPPATLDRLQARLTAADAGPSRLTAPPNGNTSTTPPGTPPPPTFSPVLPPLALPKGDSSRANLTALPPPASSTDPAANLPPEILKLLGIQNAPAPNPVAPPPSIDIATLLASVRPAPAPAPQPQPLVLASQPGLPGYTQQPPYPPAPAPAGNLPLALDARQLAALAAFIPTQQTPTPPQGTYPLPGQGGYSPAVQNPPYQQYPQGGPGYGNDNRGPPPRVNGRSPPYPQGGGNGYNNHGPGPINPEARFDGGRRDDRGGQSGGWDRPDMSREGGRSFDRGGQGRGGEQGWDRRQSGGRGAGGRSRSRSPGRGGPPRDPPMGRGNGGYGGGGGGESGDRPGHKRGRESIDRSDGGKPGVRKNYGGFKNQAGRFDPPPPALGGSNNQATTSGRAPPPPGRDVGGSRAPLPPGRDMALDEPESRGGDSTGGAPHNDNQNQRNQPAAPSNAAQIPPPNQSAQPTFNPKFGHGPGPTTAPRLETFDITSFNPMVPESWAALAEAWKGTTGTEAGQMELMGFLAGQGPVLPMGMQGMGMGMGMGQGGGGGGGGGQQGGFGMGNGMGMGMGQGMGGGGGGYMGGQTNGY